MATAQDVYKIMIRDHLSPQLRTLGFKGSGGKYEIPSSTHWIMLGLQASHYSDAEVVRFTLNCKVVRRSAWDQARSEHPYLGKKPQVNAYEGDFESSWRIGHLMPAGEDHWWRLNRSGDPAAMAREVAGVVEMFALPVMRHAVQDSDTR